MFVYEKNKKLYGTLDNTPSPTDSEVTYKDAEGNILELVEGDSYIDNKSGGIIRRSDGKQVDVLVDAYKSAPAWAEYSNLITAYTEE